MKKMIRKSIIAVAFITIAATTYGQFTLSGELRPRTEYRHGYKALADSAMNNALFTDQRTRLNLDYTTEGYRFFLSFQDIRTWGSTSQLNTTDGFSSVHQAWGEAFVSKKLSLKVGRQEISYDDQRVIGSVGWAQQARSHDAAIFKYKSSKFTAHIGGAYNQEKPQLNTTSYNKSNSYKAMQYLWLHNDFGENSGASLLVLNTGLQASWTGSDYHDNYSQTLGTRISCKKDKFAANLNGYYQMGKTNNTPARDIAAYLAGVDVSYKLVEKLTATAGFEMQSGNSQTDTSASYADINHAFTPFFGTNHKFNGHMDYFYTGNHINNVGLQDIFIKLKYKSDKFFAGADVHLFSAAANVFDSQKYNDAIANGTPPADVPIDAMSSSLGTEVDFSFGFNLAKGVSFKAGYSHMLGTETMEAIKGGDKDEISNWGWMMIGFKPTFISGKK